jgi:hypothetical protein
VKDRLAKYRKVIGTTTIVNIRHIKACDVYCGRPGPFGNPYVIGRDGTREEVLILYGIYLKKNKHLIRQAKRELVGKVCGCYCVPEPCHVEILIGCAEES